MQTAHLPLFRWSCGIVALCLLGGILAGCARSRLHPVPAQAGGASTSDDLLSSLEEERRAEAQARFAAGFLHDLRDEDEKALQEFERSVRADPSQDGLALDIARRHLLAKENDKAISVLQEAIKGGGSGLLSAFLGSIYSSLGRVEDAILANQEAIRKSPSLLLSYQNLAGLYVRQNLPQEGIKVLERAGKQSHPTPQYLVELAELWIGFPAAGAEFSELARKRAAELLDQFIKLPNNPTSLLQRAADVYLLIGQSTRAIDLYLKLVEKYPESTPLRERLANLFLQSRDPKRAREQLEALIREEPSKYPQAYLILGSLALEEGKPKEAEDYLRKAVVLAPEMESAYYDLAVAQVNTGNPRTALDTLQDARARFHETFQTEFFAGVAHARLKEFPKAITRFTAAEVIANARETNRLTPIFYFQLGSSHERNKDFEGAEHYFRKAIDRMPEFGEALNYLGYMWVEQGVKFDEAKKLIERALKLEPKNGAFLDSMAWVLFRLGRAKEALTYVEQAVQHTEEPDATLYDHQGDILQALGRSVDAATAWRKSLKVEANPEIQKKLDAASSSKANP